MALKYTNMCRFRYLKRNSLTDTLRMQGVNQELQITVVINNVYFWLCMYLINICVFMRKSFGCVDIDIECKTFKYGLMWRGGGGRFWHIPKR